MKIVHVFWSLHFGGIETMLINIANAQAKQNVDVHIVIIDDDNESIMLESFSKNVVVHLLNRAKGSKSINFIFRFNRLLSQIKPEVIHLHDTKFYGMLWSKKLSRVASVTLYALPTGSVRRRGILYRLFPILNLKANGIVVFIDKIPKVFAISDAVKKALWEDYHVKSIVITNGIVVDDFKMRGDNCPGSRIKILQVSRLEHAKKGQDLLIEAAIRLKGEVDVTFIGDGISYDYLDTLIKNNNADEYIHLLGKRTQSYLKDNLCKYDLFIQPSRWEGFGLTVAEAMASKLPVLVSSGQGPSEITQGERYGWIFKNGNAVDLADKIKWIKDNYNEAINKAHIAQNYVMHTFDISETAKKYLDAY